MDVCDSSKTLSLACSRMFEINSFMTSPFLPPAAAAAAPLNILLLIYSMSVLFPIYIYNKHIEIFDLKTSKPRFVVFIAKS